MSSMGHCKIVTDGHDFSMFFNSFDNNFKYATLV